MNPFQTERETIAGKLAAAGVPATLNPRAPLPCVLVDLPGAGPVSVGIGAWPAVFPVRILVPPPGDADAANWLLDQLANVLVVFPGASTDWQPETIGHGGDDVPGYTVNIPSEVPNPNC